MHPVTACGVLCHHLHSVWLLSECHLPPPPPSVAGTVLRCCAGHGHDPGSRLHAVCTRVRLNHAKPYRVVSCFVMWQAPAAAAAGVGETVRGHPEDEVVDLDTTLVVCQALRFLCGLHLKADNRRLMTYFTSFPGSDKSRLCSKIAEFV